MIKTLFLYLFFTVIILSPVFAGDEISMDDSCQSLNMTWSWQKGDRIVMVSKDQNVIVCPGMSEAHVNGHIVKLPQAVRYENGNPVIPLASLNVIKHRLENKAVSQSSTPDIKKREPQPKTQSKRFQTVLIDPGHGGSLPGAINRSEKLTEKQVNLWIALQLRDILKAAGLQVFMTRETDTQFHNDVARDLAARSRMANEVMPDFFISIHANAASSSSARGFEVYYDSQQWERGDKARSAARRVDLEEEKLGGKVQVDEKTEALLFRMMFDENIMHSKSMAELMVASLDKSIDDSNRGIKTKNLHVTREVFIPSVLVETGFLSHRATARRFKTKAYRQLIAQALADAVLEYKSQYDRSQGFVE